MSTKYDKLTGRKVELETRLKSATTELAKTQLTLELRRIDARLAVQSEIDSIDAELEKMTLPILSEKLERARENLTAAQERVTKLENRIKAISEA